MVEHIPFGVGNTIDVNFHRVGKAVILGPRLELSKSNSGTLLSRTSRGWVRFFSPQHSHMSGHTAWYLMTVNLLS